MNDTTNTRRPSINIFHCHLDTIIFCNDICSREAMQMIHCPDCWTIVELEGIGYICDPPDAVAKLYYYKCPKCGKSVHKEVILT